MQKLGASNLSNSELIAIILKTGTKNFNVYDIALNLLNKYSIDNLKEITLEELTKIKGIGQVKAIELLAVLEFSKRLYTNTKKENKRLISPKDIFLNTRYLFIDKKQEYFYCLYFNNHQELIERKLLFMGTINKSIIHPREIFKEAYKVSASSIICMHNHPSGDLTPSKADIDLTESLIKIGALQGIPVLDHIIVSNDSYYSFYDHKNKLSV